MPNRNQVPAADCGLQIVILGEDPEHDVGICGLDPKPPGYDKFCNTDFAKKCPSREDCCYCVEHTLDGHTVLLGNVIYVKGEFDPEGD